MKKTKQELQAENEELRSRLEEAEETLNAIRSGEVDALLVDGKDGQQIYTLSGADRTYRLLLESMSEGAVTLNPDGFIIYCNSFFAQLLKTPLDKLIGARLLDFIPQAEKHHFASLLAQCGRGETILKAADNCPVPVYLSVNTLPSEPGQQLTCVIATDLSEQKRDEKIIADGKLAQFIFRQAGEAIIVCDKSGKIILASNAAHTLCGQNPLYQPFDELFPLTLERGKHFTIAQALRRQATQSSDAGFLRKDGATFDLILKSSRLVDENKKILGCIVTLSDITERKRAETKALSLLHDLQVHQTELQQQQEVILQANQEIEAGLKRYTELYDFAPIGYFTLLGDGTIKKMNLTGARLFGEDQSRILNRRFALFIATQYRVAFSEALKKVFTTGENQICAAEVLTDNPNPISVEIILSPGNEAQTCLAVLSDITARKRAEERNLRQNALVGGINALLTAALTCNTAEELGRACLKIAEQITESKFGFIGELNEKGLEDIAISNPGWDACTVIDSSGHRRPSGNFMIHGIYGKVISDVRGFFTNDPAHHPDRIGFPAGHPPLDSFLGVPLVHQGRATGIIAVGNREGGYTPDEQEMLEALAPVIVEAFQRMQFEAELRKSEERFRVLANAMPQLAWTAQPDGYITWYNERWYKYTGTTPAQMEGWGWQSVHDPKALPEVLERWKYSISTGETFDMEFPLRGADGVFRSFLTRGYPLKNEAGRVEQWFGTNTDITERKLSEEALRESEERLQLVLEASSMGTFEVDLASGEGIWNSVEFELLGLKPGDVPGNPATFFRYIHPDDLELVKARWAEASRLGELDVEFRIVRADGKERWLAGKGRFAFEGKDGGQAVRFLGVNFDITERKRAEKKLWESEAVLRDIIATVADPLYVKDAEGRLTLANPATAAVVGKPLEQIIGHADREFYDDPVAFEAIEENDRRVMQSGTVHIFEETVPTPTGYRVLLNTKAPRRDSKGLVVGLVGVACDITDRKRMDEDLKKRTAELEEANRDLESFSYSVSHDLRSPLYAINGFTAMILKNQGAAFDEDTRNKFDVIKANTKKMGQLIEDLLNFSRIGRKAMRFVTLAMADLVRDVWKDLQHSNPERVMTLDIKDMPAASADRSLIHEVYTNLIGNAVKFTKQCPAAHIEAGSYTDGDENIYYIQDNGAGFDMAYYEKLFGIFQRLHSADEYGGTGIGLTIVQRIIHKHGGRVWAEGKVGEGATFYFTLPGGSSE